MGKVDDLRKMREARYLLRHGMLAPKAAPEPAPDTTWVETVEIKDYGKCGHKGVGGKTCTRPKDHSEKNHRYK
jgi:hypothetical protein